MKENMTYIKEMRELAESILAGIQQLEAFKLSATNEDIHDALRVLRAADGEVWAAIDWLEGDRIG